MAEKEAFLRDHPLESLFVNVLRRLHGFHVYLKEQWSDYLFPLTAPDGEPDTALLFNMAHKLATNWALPEQDNLPSDEENAPIGKTTVALADERILTLHDPLSPCPSGSIRPIPLLSSSCVLTSQPAKMRPWLFHRSN